MTGPTLELGADPKDIVECELCGAKCVWLAGPNGLPMLIEAEPEGGDFRKPYGGEPRYVHWEHKPHFCQGQRDE